MDWYIYDCVADKTNCWRIQKTCEASHISLASQAMTNVKHLAECYSICLTPAKILSSMLISILALAKMNQRLLSSNLTSARMNNLAVLRLLKSFDFSRITIANRFYNCLSSEKISFWFFIAIIRFLLRAWQKASHATTFRLSNVNIQIFLQELKTPLWISCVKRTIAIVHSEII